MPHHTLNLYPARRHQRLRAESLVQVLDLIHVGPGFVIVWHDVAVLLHRPFARILGGEDEMQLAGIVF